MWEGNGGRGFAFGRVTFCAARKSPKSRQRGEGFRFPSPPRYPIPLKRPTSSSRTSYPSPGPKGQGSLIPSLVLSQWNPLRWASIGSPLRVPTPSVSLRSTSPPDRGSRPPIGCTPRGTVIWKGQRRNRCGGQRAEGPLQTKRPGVLQPLPCPRN